MSAWTVRNSGLKKAIILDAATTPFADLHPQTPSGVLRLDGHDVLIMDYSAAFAHRLGFSPDLPPGICLRDVLSADVEVIVLRAMRRCIGARRTTRITIPVTRPGVGVKFVPLLMKYLERDYVLATAPETIVFGRRRTDRDMLETLGAVDKGTIYVLDMKSTSVIYATDRVNELIGYSREAIEGLVVDPSAPSSDFFQGLFHPDDLAAVALHFTDLRQASDDMVLTLLCRVRHATAGWRWVEARSRVLSRDRQGEVERVVGVAVDISEQRQLTADLRATSFALLRAEENERRRIAREIHDSTAQHLVAMDLALSRLDGMPPGDSAARREWIDEMRALTRTAQQELRVATFALHPPELEQAGLPDTLRDLMRGFGRRTGLAAEFQLGGAPRETAPAAEHALLRVSQEALLNIHKHARAKVARLRLIYSEKDIVLEIEDDGIGGDMMQAGVGLQSMKTRLAALGGVLSIASGRNGFMVRARIHWRDEAAGL